MKRKKIIKHRIEQKTSEHKHARHRRGGTFRLIAKGQKIKMQKQIRAAWTKAKDATTDTTEKKEEKKEEE